MTVEQSEFLFDALLPFAHRRSCPEVCGAGKNLNGRIIPEPVNPWSLALPLPICRVSQPGNEGRF
jgi:hypothetical protein